MIIYMGLFLMEFTTYYIHSKINVFAFKIRWMPESARWLIANGKLMQAQMYLKKCAKMNRTEQLTDTLKTEVSIFQMIVKGSARRF